MPNVTLKKSDKIHALEGMTNKKFLGQYKALVERQKSLALRVYNETYGKTGNKLKELAGTEWVEWLTKKDSFYLCGCSTPELIIEGKGSRRHGSNYKDMFTGLSDDFSRRHYVDLKESVAWPSKFYNDRLIISNASKATQKVAATLNVNIKEFNKEVKQFYANAYSVLMQLRSSKKVDEMFPELWEYLPPGTKERVKQAVVVINQKEVDEIRLQLKGSEK